MTKKMVFCLLALALTFAATVPVEALPPDCSCQKCEAVTCTQCRVCAVPFSVEVVFCEEYVARYC